MNKPELLRKVCSGCFVIKHPKEFSEGNWVCDGCPSLEESREETLEESSPQPEVCPSGTRKCNSCNRILPDVKFAGRGNKCANCRKGRYKTCKACGKSGDSDIFRRGQQICRDCESAGAVVDQECNECGETKPSSSFRKNRKKCTDCERGFGRNYRRTTTKSKEWAQANPKRMAELQKDWYEKNKPNIRAQHREKWKNDPEYRDIKSYRIGIASFIKLELKTNSRLETDRETFLQWMDFCNVENVDFTDRSSWNLDHVIPLDLLLSNTKNVRYAESMGKDNALHCIYLWMNVCPVRALTNRKKNKNVSYEPLLAHRKRLIEFTKTRPQLRTDDYFTYINACQHILDMFGRV